MRIENPISSEMSHLRPDLLPGLLAAAARNQARGFADLALFELGPVFSGGEPGEQTVQLTGLLVGASAPRAATDRRLTIAIATDRASLAPRAPRAAADTTASRVKVRADLITSRAVKVRGAMTASRALRVRGSCFQHQ